MKKIIIIFSFVVIAAWQLLEHTIIPKTFIFWLPYGILSDENLSKHYISYLEEMKNEMPNFNNDFIEAKYIAEYSVGLENMRSYMKAVEAVISLQKNIINQNICINVNNAVLPLLDYSAKFQETVQFMKVQNIEKSKKSVTSEKTEQFLEISSKLFRMNSDYIGLIAEIRINNNVINDLDRCKEEIFELKVEDNEQVAKIRD